MALDITGADLPTSWHLPDEARITVQASRCPLSTDNSPLLPGPVLRPACRTGTVPQDLVANTHFQVDGIKPCLNPAGVQLPVTVTLMAPPSANHGWAINREGRRVERRADGLRTQALGSSSLLP